MVNAGMWLVETVDWIIHDIQLETNKVKKKYTIN